MHEIASFAVFIHGSSQLEQLIAFTLNVELHRKVTIKLYENHRKTHKTVFQPVGAVQVPMFSIVGWLAGWLAG